MSDLLERVLASPNLPSLSVAAIQVVQLAQDPDVEIDDFAAAIEIDPALTMRILRAANSSYYGLAHDVATVPRAVMVLGLSTVRMLALGFTLVHNIRRSEQGAFDFAEFWRRNVFTGVGARLIAERVAAADPDEAFVVGLLRGIGILAIQSVERKAYNAMYDAARGDHALLAHLERLRWDTDHTVVGAALAREWKLPDVITAGIEHYLDPEAARDSHRGLVTCVALSRLMAEVADERITIEAYPALLGSAQTWFGFSESEVAALYARIQSEAAEMTTLFDLPDAGRLTAEETLRKAHAALAELSLHAIEEQARWRRDAEMLADEVATDALTGVASRRALISRLTHEIEMARPTDGVIGVLMVDVDNFKRINDTYGHRFGDDVLLAVARTLKRGGRARDFVARYGGDEFVVLLPGSSAQAARFVAGRLRQAIENLDLRSPDKERVRVTVSIGTTEFTPDSADGVEALLDRADQALYIAKAGGRNRVARVPVRTSRRRAS